MTTTATAQHICHNCGLKIKPEEEIEVPKSRGRAVKYAGRFRHRTYELCSAAEAEVARWD